MCRETNKDGEQLIDIVERHEKQIYWLFTSQFHANEKDNSNEKAIENIFTAIKSLCFAIILLFAFVAYKTWGL